MRSVAFLRSINVGGRRATKPELIGAFTGAGYDDVDTFLASGNVLFDGEPDVAAIEAALAEKLGYEVPTTIRTADELVAIAEATPFTDDQVAASEGKPQVLLLFDPPPAPAAQVEVVAVADGIGDLLAFGPRELHWLPPAGMSTSELDLRAVGHLVGTNTVRTINTIRRLRQIVGS